MTSPEQERRTCEQCGFHAPAIGAFCPKCGHRFVAEPVSAPLGSAQSTMMFGAFTQEDLPAHLSDPLAHVEEDEHTLQVRPEAREQVFSAPIPKEDKDFFDADLPDERALPTEPKAPPAYVTEGKTRKTSPSGGYSMVTGDFLAAEESMPKEVGATSMYIELDGQDSEDTSSAKSEPSKKQVMNQTLMFGVDAPLPPSLAASETSQVSMGSTRSIAPFDASTAFLEQMAGGHIQTSFANEDSKQASVVQASPKPVDMNKTAAFGDIAAQMAEMAKLAAEQQKHDDVPEHSPMTKTVAMDLKDIQQWMQDSGMELAAAPEEKVEDATALVAEAEKAVSSGQLEQACELYLQLLSSFPQEQRYQDRLKQLWIMMREKAATEATLRTSASHSMPEQRPLWLYLIAGFGSAASLLFLALIWPGWLRSVPPATKPPSHVRPLQAVHATGTIQINSTPTGAQVWLDGEKTTYTTPVTIKKPAGSYQLTLVLDGYHSLRKKIKLQSSQMFTMEFGLAPKAPVPVDNPSDQPIAPPTPTGQRPTVRRRMLAKPRKVAFRLVSVPSGAAISIDDRATGKKTPSTFQLKRGRHQFQLELPGYQTYIRDVQVVRRGRPFVVRLVRTAPTQARLSIETKPTGASIVVNGKDVGKRTPAVLSLPPGKVTIQLTKKGHMTQSESLSLKQGEVRRLSRSLSKKGPGDMVYVRGGAFWMGNNAGISREKPMRRVTLSGFWIDRFEVSVGEYNACVKAGRCLRRPHKAGCNVTDPTHPVNCVTWYEALRFCRWKKKTLPTEAQWEKAARGTTTQLYPWGHSSPSCRRAQFNQQCGVNTRPVKSLPAGRSPYGAYHMTGNVWEWVRDYFDRNYYKKAPPKNPYNKRRGSGYRVIRGGAWKTAPDYVHVTYRLEYWPSRRSNTIGFRCVR